MLPSPLQSYQVRLKVSSASSLRGTSLSSVRSRLCHWIEMYTGLTKSEDTSDYRSESNLCRVGTDLMVGNRTMFKHIESCTSMLDFSDPTNLSKELSFWFLVSLSASKVTEPDASHVRSLGIFRVICPPLQIVINRLKENGKIAIPISYLKWLVWAAKSDRISR